MYFLIKSLIFLYNISFLKLGGLFDFVNCSGISVEDNDLFMYFYLICSLFLKDIIHIACTC